jgi:hypothetical protein
MYLAGIRGFGVEFGFLAFGVFSLAGYSGRGIPWRYERAAHQCPPIARRPSGYQKCLQSRPGTSQRKYRTVKSNPITGLDRPWGFQEVEVPRFQDKPYAPAAFTPRTKLLVLISAEGWLDPQDRSAARRIMSMKNSNETIANRTRDLPACNAVPQTTAPPSALKYWTVNDNIRGLN